MSADGKCSFITVWEFRVHPERHREFEKAYGRDGDWATLFRRGDGYIRTELYRDPKMPGRYFTLDFWQSRQELEDFKRTHAAEYAALDAKCESLTQAESFLGACVTPEEARELLYSRGFESRGWESAQSRREICIRGAVPTDIPAMLALEISVPSAAHWRKQAYERIFDPDSPPRIAWVAINEVGILCGFAIGRIASGECELENIVVAEAARRRGVGEKLLEGLIDSARGKKAVRMLLEVRESNHAARNLYEHCGFTISSRRRSYYSAPVEDALIYTLPL